MADYKAPLRDMRFILNEVFDAPTLWETLPALAEVVDAETAEAILEEAGKITGNTVSPHNRSGDEAGCHWDNGAVCTPAGYRDAYKPYTGSGWAGVAGGRDNVCMGMP